MQNRSILKKIKDHIIDNASNTIDAVFSNNPSIRDIASNLYISRDKAIYKYIINSVNGIKEFSTFNEANTYFKKYTSAQYMKSASTYVSQNNNIKEHLLQLTITLSSRNRLYNDLVVKINANKDHIKNYDQLKQQLNNVPRS